MREQTNNKATMEMCRQILTTLVKIDTCQPEGNEEKLVDAILQMLPDDITYKKIEHAPGRASLVVKVEGETPKGGIAFVGHIDTVACSNLDSWIHPPHEAVVEGDVLYGRGSSDMKGGDTAMIITLKNLLSGGKKPKTPVYFCFTADEESKGMGICAVVKDGCINDIEEMVICEPSDEKIGICEKGALWLHVSVQGKASHASRPDLGVNAVDYAIEFSNRLKAAAEGKEEHSILGSTTVSVTRFNGGIMTNIIPSEAEMELDIRTVPGTSHERILELAHTICREMSEKSPYIHMAIQVLNNRPALETDLNSPFVRNIMKAAEEAGISTEPKGLYFYTDASQVIPKINVPFVIAGPGDDAMAHCMNECISLSSVARYAEMYSNYIEQYYI